MEIVNKHHLPKSSLEWPKGCVYVGRGSPLGNPFLISAHSDREEVVRRYEVWLRKRIRAGDSRVLAALNRLGDDSILVCYCAPLRCHAEVIRKVWKELHGPRA